MDPVTVCVVFGVALLVFFCGFAAYVLLTHKPDESDKLHLFQPTVIAPAGAELINSTDTRSILRHKVDVSYDPRSGADEQDSAELDTHKRERIQAVVAGSMTLEARVPPHPAQPDKPVTRPMPWPAPEQQQSSKVVDEKRKTRLRQLLRDTQSSD